MGERVTIRALEGCEKGLIAQYMRVSQVLEIQ